VARQPASASQAPYNFLATAPVGALNRREKSADEYDVLRSLLQFASSICNLLSDLPRDLPSPILVPGLCFLALAGHITTIRSAWFILKRHDDRRIDSFLRMASYGSVLWHSLFNQNPFASIQPVALKSWG